MRVNRQRLVRTLGAPLALTMALVLAAPGVGYGQNAPPAQAEDDPDRDPNPSQPDFAIVNLPTTLRMPRFKSSFRVTHRFGRPLGAGDFGELAEDLFGLDSGALIGLEYRFGLMRGLQVGIIRTSDRTIELFTQYNLMNQRDGKIVGLGVIGSIDGTDNFTDSYSPALGAVISREFGDHGTLYVEPIWVNNSNPDPAELADDNDTFMVGIGTRIRVRPTIYVVGEFIPRVGFTPDVHHGTFGIEKRAGGHVFQVNFSNGRGNAAEDWYLGFNISRKFF
jgi:hypothetical protein